MPKKLNELGYDDWGFSPQDAKLLMTLGRQIYRYFRPVVTGIENVPAGRTLLICNHSGQLPFDGMVVGMSMVLDARPPRIVRAMVERWLPTLPWISTLFYRTGQVVGDPVNCEHLLRQDNAIIVFPEGAAGCGKTIWHRYDLVRFGRGFMRLALKTNTPILPVGIVGAEESIPSIYDFKPLARLLGMPYLPVTPHSLVLGPLGLLPLPTRFYLNFGKPMLFEGDHDAPDEVINEKVERVKDGIREMIGHGLRQRKGLFR
ncbi:MAG: acyltransferase family protein [Candidatus Schekmanbacteria bacterium]|nr:acyltransferase family protein [Candidatus Schekmanbacteria bacterium]